MVLSYMNINRSTFPNDSRLPIQVDFDFRVMANNEQEAIKELVEFVNAHFNNPNQSKILDI